MDAVSANLLPCDGEAFYHARLFSHQQSHIYFNKLLKDIEWQEKSIKIFGKQIMQPRLMAWYGNEEAKYTYSGLQLTPLAWTDVLLSIKGKVEEYLQTSFNSALLNLYRDGQDSMGAHRDNEKELGDQPVIASVSFGVERVFYFHHISNTALKLRLLLENGSLLVMKGRTQEHWKHGINKSKKVEEPRVNITFRTIRH